MVSNLTCSECGFTQPHIPRVFGQRRPKQDRRFYGYDPRFSLVGLCDKCSPVVFQRSNSEKACAECGDSKPLKAFPIDRHEASGLDRRCHECVAARDAARIGKVKGKKAGRQSLDRSKGNARRLGFIYVVREVGTVDLVKIGFSHDPVKRLADCKTFNPRPLEIWITFRAGDSAERHLFRQLKERDLHAGTYAISEWFRFTAETKALLKRERDYWQKNLAFLD